MGHQLQDQETKLFLDLYKHMFSAREIDRIEEDYTKRGEAFFTVSGAGHEAAAVLAPLFTAHDWLHCHYRDKALMLARGLDSAQFFHSLFTNRESHSAGRQMSAHISAPHLKILSIVGPVGNSALQAVGVAKAVRDTEGAPVVLCSLGDGMIQQGEVLEAIAHAVRDGLPVLFFIEDNKYAISTRTRGKTFYELPEGRVDSFYGIPITYVDGTDAVTAYRTLKDVVAGMREDRKPRIVVFDVERLCNHTNADDESVYRPEEERKRVREVADPIKKLRQVLIENGIAEEELASREQEWRKELEELAARCQLVSDPEPIFTAKKPLPPELEDPSIEDKAPPLSEEEVLVMRDAINRVLEKHLAENPGVFLFGEDIEDPKGDVFGVTRGLTRKFPGRVQNSPLAESSILGISIGMALAGKRPVAFLQFADFLPIAFNQMISELGSMWWRTNGGWECPVIVMISCGGYKPGLGPFHASTMEGIAAHIPGVDVFMPSSADDAAGLLNAAFASGRPTLFFYPKSMLNNRQFAATRDVRQHLVPIGRAKVLRRGEDLTMVTWGNNILHCLKAAETLSQYGVETEVIDLRSIVPWDKETVLASVKKTGRLIVVHEDTHTAGMGAEIVATAAEEAGVPVEVVRVTRADTYVPCNFPCQLEVLPSYKRVLTTAVEMLGGSIRWQEKPRAEAGYYFLEAVGSSPSDERITILEWKVKEGDAIKAGEIVAEAEADKAAVEIRASVDGVVEELLVQEGESAPVGSAIAKIRLPEGAARKEKPLTQEEPGTPLIEGLGGAKKKARLTVEAPREERATVRDGGEGALPVIVDVAGRPGSRVVTNEEISRMCPTWTPEDIVRRTGIQERRWGSDDEDILSLSVDAVQRLFEKTGARIEDVGAIICATTTPPYNSPALATLLQNRLSEGKGGITCPAYDINAACSGYLYALQIAYDYLSSRPKETVLVVTADVLSRRLDTSDPSTAPVFADGASATLVAGPEAGVRGKALLYRPVLSAEGEDGSILRIPYQEPIFMDGPAVYQRAVKALIHILRRALEEAGFTVEDMDLMVPHQANQRIIDAVRKRMGLPEEKVFSNIARLGNTSATTIPLCFEEIFPTAGPGMVLGLTAFGAGFTFAGGVVKTL
ncbi:Transketolase domain-containing protein [Spirochaeta thermophila DSM 6578]|uniref:3-methyl-2-oxobutanoate dehydrogenase (2-methylpropanoyl-transferring) n=1 Tax=Winmispira thermophila (strain ATCC 700085 / DSM 6578 / Z-1203) TaxID=869211 RepID=G0GEE3_WINT7|nr:beta-ketoacyl-ACP synthase 3 [Spirochaeta thermophila]AEJ62280.1 Transketolase domain-containing protein [Spirochaeta thermophila DSM 6578]